MFERCQKEVKEIDEWDEFLSQEWDEFLSQEWHELLSQAWWSGKGSE